MTKRARPWQYGVMVLTALAGLLLAVVGYNAPTLSTKLATTATRPPAAATATARTADPPPASGTAKASANTSGGGSGQGATASAPAAATHSATKTAKASTGPLLSSTPYGRYAHQIYPGTMTAAAKQAMSGFRVSFQPPSGGKVKVTITTAAGQPQSASFAATDHLYFVETRLGDDGFSQDTNFGDDGFILTDSGGHIVGK